MWCNKNAGNPNAWTRDFDKTGPGIYRWPSQRHGTARLTWQATPRNKFNLHWSEQYNASNNGKGGGTATTTPEASGRVLFHPVPHIQQATWSSPVSSRMLLEAGWGIYQARYRNPGPRNDGTHNDRMIRVTEQGGEIPNLTLRISAGPRPGGGGFKHHADWHAGEPPRVGCRMSPARTT